MKTSLTALTLGFVALWSTSLHAEFRQFTSTYGVKMMFELVSHDGTGKTVTLKTEKGDLKKGMKLEAFSAADQTFIKDWMKKTPPTIDYKFRWEAKKTRVSGVNNGSKSGTSRTAQWAYDVSLINSSRTPVSKLTVKYQIHRVSKFESAYSSYSRTAKPLEIFSGEVKVEKNLSFNAAADFQTDQVEIVTIDDTDYSYRDRRDSLLGIHFRVYDERGKLVAEHRTEGVDTATWKGEEKKAKVVR